MWTSAPQFPVSSPEWPPNFHYIGKKGKPTVSWIDSIKEAIYLSLTRSEQAN